MPPRVLVFIPTYNERENISALIKEVLGRGIPGLGVLVVDDSSPDGTAAIVEELAKTQTGLSLLRRSGPPGRGWAGREGFLHALEHGAEFLVEMDGDFSHRPDQIPRLLEAMKACDVAVGSRLIAGGSDADRGWARRWLTQAANAFVRSLLGLPVRDPNSGFRCFSRKALAALDPGSLGSRGPSILHETLFRAAAAGLRIREVPIDFRDRREGSSKLNLGRLLAGWLWILRLRLGR